MKGSLSRYVEAKRRSSLSSEILDSEAKKLFSYFREYIKSKKSEKVQNFENVLDEFYSEVLGLDGNEYIRIRSSLTKRFKMIARKNIVSDSEKQKTLDDYIL